jgi:excisionase family DNA binding protein
MARERREGRPGELAPSNPSGMTDMTTPDALGLREAAEAINLAPSTLRRHIRAGRLPAAYGAGPCRREIRIKRADLADFLDRRQAAGFVWNRKERPVEPVTLGELLRWTESSDVRIRSVAWARTCPDCSGGNCTGVDAGAACCRRGCSEMSRGK